MREQARWEAMLAELADHLAAQRRCLASGHPEEITTYTPPVGLGPLPDDLRHRFDELCAESLAMQEEVSRLRDELGRRLASLPRRRGRDTNSSPACFIDVSA